MNILIAINSAYIDHAKVMLYSLARHNLGHLNIYLIYNTLKEAELTQLKAFIAKYCHGEFYPIKIDSKMFQKFSVRGHFSIETYYRIYAQYLLPETIERILWLDADIIVKDSLKVFYEAYFNGNCFIACENESEINKENIKRLGIKCEKYFNAGVILMNLKAMRGWMKQEELEKKIDENLSLFIWQDQDILNFIYDGATLFEDGRFNCQVRGGQKNVEKKAENAAVLHYVGAQKPWLYYYRDGAREYYLSYLKYVNRKRFIQVQVCASLYRLLKGKQVDK